MECNADFKDAAILFKQPNHEQPIKWHYDRQEGKPPKEATLTVSKKTGDFNMKGGNLRVDGYVVAKGFSGDGVPARNLRGKNVPVKRRQREVKIAFPVEEPDEDYAVFVEPSWLTYHAVKEQTARGFTVAFRKRAPKDAKLHWMIVR